MPEKMAVQLAAHTAAESTTEEYPSCKLTRSKVLGLGGAKHSLPLLITLLGICGDFGFQETFSVFLTGRLMW